MENNRPLGWTTLEEAKLLVEAGIDPNTADMSYDFVVCKVFNGNPLEDWLLQPFPPDENQPNEQLPCWSLGALEKLIPDDIKVNDVTFFYHASYNGIRKWSSSYTNEDLYRLIIFANFQKRIEMLVQTVLFLLQNNHIKKQE